MLLRFPERRRRKTPLRVPCVSFHTSLRPCVCRAIFLTQASRSAPGCVWSANYVLYGVSHVCFHSPIPPLLKGRMFTRERIRLKNFCQEKCVNMTASTSRHWRVAEAGWIHGGRSPQTAVCRFE
uniref:Uncharacterized protein n=1 Tax=Gasterosteus aculeatus TaxID=69293 RepID=G3NLT7_GASAC